MKKFIVGFFFVLRLAFNLLFVGIENGDKTILDVKMVDGNRVTFSRSISKIKNLDKLRKIICLETRYYCESTSFYKSYGINCGFCRRYFQIKNSFSFK
jgi:hypothetical protein